MNVRNRLRQAALAAAVLLLAGCAGEIGVTRVGAAGRAEYGAPVTAKGITQDTYNLLGNFLLEETYDERPLELIGELEKLFRSEPRPEYLAALADCALNLGLRERSDPDLAVRFHLSAGGREKVQPVSELPDARSIPAAAAASGVRSAWPRR